MRGRNQPRPRASERICMCASRLLLRGEGEIRKAMGRTEDDVCSSLLTSERRRFRRISARFGLVQFLFGVAVDRG